MFLNKFQNFENIVESIVSELVLFLIKTLFFLTNNSWLFWKVLIFGVLQFLTVVLYFLNFKKIYSYINKSMTLLLCLLHYLFYCLITSNVSYLYIVYFENSKYLIKCYQRLLKPFYFRSTKLTFSLLKRFCHLLWLLWVDQAIFITYEKV